MQSGENRPGEGPEEKNSLWRLDRLIDGEITFTDKQDATRSGLDSPLASSYLADPPQMDLDAGWRRLQAGIRARPPDGEAYRNPSRPVSSGWFAWLGRRPGIALAALPLVGGLVFLSLTTTTDTTQGFRSKGGGKVEVRMKINGKEYAPGASIPAKAGDTAYILYRAPEPAHVSIWYRQDQGETRELEGERPERWPASLAWKIAPQAALLDGEWREQRVWVLASSDSLTSKESMNILSGREKGPSSHADSFLLHRIAP